MDGHTKLHIIKFIKDQITNMAEEYAKRPSSYFKCIWVPNTDYLVKVFPDGETILMSPIDENINNVYTILYEETNEESTNEEEYYNQKKAIRFIFLYYEKIILNGQIGIVDLILIVVNI